MHDADVVRRGQAGAENAGEVEIVFLRK